MKSFGWVKKPTRRIDAGQWCKLDRRYLFQIVRGDCCPTGRLAPARLTEIIVDSVLPSRDLFCPLAR